MFPKNALSGARLALAALLFAALPARAADKTVLRPILDVEQGWDSNTFNDSGNDSASLVTRVSPGIWLENTGERGQARLGLNAIGREIWHESELSGIDSNVRGDFDRMLTPRLTVFGDGALDFYSGYQEINAGGPVGSPGDLLLAEQPAWKRDRLASGFRYLLTPRLSFRLNGSAGRINYEAVNVGTGSQGEFRDRSIFDARTKLLYQLTALDQVDLSIDGDDTSYQNLTTINPNTGLLASSGTNDSTIWNATVGWSRDWTQYWKTSVSIGAREIDTTQNGVSQSGTKVCTIALFGVQIVQECGSEALTPRSYSFSGTGLVGSIAVERSFERSAIRLSYDRDTRSTGGSGRTNFDIDSFALSIKHRLAERVTLSLTGDYSLYHSVTNDFPSYAARIRTSFDGNVDSFCGFGGNAESVAMAPSPSDPSQLVPVYQCFGGSSKEKRKYTSLSARIDWQLRRKLTAYVVTRYYQSQTDQSLGSGINIATDDVNKFTLGVGFHYYWDIGL